MSEDLDRATPSHLFTLADKQEERSTQRMGNVVMKRIVYWICCVAWLWSVNLISIIRAEKDASSQQQDSNDASQNNSSSSSSSSSSNSDNSSISCGIYMAMVPAPWYSTIKVKNEEEDAEDDQDEVPDQVGRWALFTGRGYESGDFLDTPPELSLPLVSFGNVYLEQLLEEKGEDSMEYELAHATMAVLFESLWGGEHDGSAMEMYPEESTLTIVPGIGLLSSIESTFHRKFNELLQHNVKFDVLSVHRRHMVYDSNKDFGPFTTYFNMTLVVSEEEGLAAGTELVLPGMYDEDEEDEEDEEDDYNPVLEPKHFGMLKGFMQQVQTFFSDNDIYGISNETSKDKMYEFLMTHYLDAALGRPQRNYVAKYVFPPDLKSFQTLFMDKIQDQELEEGAPLFFGQPPSLSWLEKNAMCIDSKSTVQPAPSTIPNAGHGAFAAKDFTAHQRILTVPLLPIPDSQLLDYILPDGTMQKQVVLNYCYGHPESDLLFLPLAPGANYINHHSSKANVKLQWSTDPKLMSNQEALVRMDPRVLLLDMFRPRTIEDDPPISTGFPAVGGLTMEIVATRDISQEEELFLDYQAEWENAWQTHQDTCSATEMTPHPQQAVHWNEAYLDKPLPTTDEQVEDPLPDNVTLKIFAARNRNGDVAFYLEDACNVLEIVKRRSTNSENKDWIYTVKVENPALGREDFEGEEVLKLSGVPHSHFFFADVPGTSSLYRASFRHFIGIPDEIFPRGQWRTKK